MLTMLAFAAAAMAGQADLTKPKPIVVPRFTMAACLDEDEGTELLDAFGDGGLPGSSGSSYDQQWMAYLRERLGKLGMTPEEQKAFLTRVTTSKKFTSLQQKNANILASIGEDLEAVDDAEDEKQECRILARAFGKLQPYVNNSQKQWEYIDAEIKAEAKRRGIKLD